ncbi:MAG: 2OG-Fe(II) oxygenase [Betaproteobacteria bacterium]|nr:2OG-Fe(II) oxygenase [Betaproteobacteria bacterium]
MFDVLLADLAGPGWHVAPGFLTPEEIDALHDDAQARQAAGAFHAAGVGKGSAQVRGEIRGDHVFWIDESQAAPPLRAVLERLETLRQAVNQALFLGLFDVELHYAVYPPGAGYQRHLDRFRDDDRRTLTVILYLNPPDWGEEDGGQLLFWPNPDVAPQVIAPLGGTLVTFLSERFWHEVTPARRDRVSLTGWFRRR